MIDDFTAATSILPAEAGAWYPDDDHLIPYQMTYRAKHSQPLERADLARWIQSPEVRAW